MKQRIINENTVLCRECKYYTGNRPVEIGVQYDGTCNRLDVPVNETDFCKKGISRNDEI